MLDLTGLSLWLNSLILIVCAGVIAVAGTKLSAVADELAERTGMGQVLAGAVFIGASTSLPGIVTSTATAAEGYAGLAIGNSLGGLTAQTTFLAVADLVYRRANLEHAAASVEGMTQSTLLITLLTFPLLAMTLPGMTLYSIHPATPLLFIVYGFGLKLLTRVKDNPMWSPVETEETENMGAGAEQARRHGPEQSFGFSKLWWRFSVYAALTAVAGYLVGEASIGLLAGTALSETAVGTLFTAVANSLPELVTAIAAVRRGALSLAVGDIIGGNSFEVLFLAFADIVYRPGSIYSEMGPDDVFIAVLAILMTGILLLGLLRRQQVGIARIGFESGLVLGLYAVSVVVVLA